MEVNLQAIAAMRAATVSREYGSGGGEIAARLAKRLGWQLIDHQVVTQVARELAIPEPEAEARDENVESRVTRIMNRLRLGVSGGFVTPSAGISLGVPLSTPSSSPSAEAPSSTVGEQVYYEALQQFVQAATNTGHVVIVGRGGQVILSGRRDVLHVRVVATLEQRIAYVMRREGLDEAAARARIQMKERARTRYMQTLYHCNHEDPHLYDLVLNTGVLDLDSAVNVICVALEQKASRLHVPVEEVGPAAGLTRYAGQPADFPVPPRSS